MKLKNALVAAPLLLALSAQLSHAAISEGSGETVIANNLLYSSSVPVNPPAFTGGSSYEGVLELFPIVPVTIPALSSSSFFFFETGEGTGDGISVSGVSGQFPILRTYYLPTTSIKLTLSEDPVNPSPVPIPAAFLLLASGLAALAGFRGKMYADQA